MRYMIPPPTSFRILGQRFSVRVAQHDEPLLDGTPRNAVGATDMDRQVVRVREVGPGGQSEHQQLDTLLHEVLHALFYTTGIESLARDDDRNQENLIGALAPHLLAFLRENPRVVEYLMQRMP